MQLVNMLSSWSGVFPAAVKTAPASPGVEVRSTPPKWSTTQPLLVPGPVQGGGGVRGVGVGKRCLSR